MNTIHYVIIVLLLAILLFVMIKFKNKISLTICGLFIILLIIYTLLFSFNNNFNFMVNKIINPTVEHRVTQDNESIYVPLCNNVVLDYRFSDTGARYVTSKSFDQVVECYQEMDNIDDLLVNDTEKSLDFKVDDVTVKIEFKSDDHNKLNYLKIDVK